MDFNTLAELQAELQAAENERALLLKQVAASPLEGIDSESYSDDEDDSPQPDRSCTLPPPPLPPAAAAPRKVLNWGVGAASGHRSKQRHLHAADVPQAAAQRNAPCSAGSEVDADKEVGGRACRAGIQESSEGSPGSGSPAQAYAPASESYATNQSASTERNSCSVVAKAGNNKYHGDGGAKGGDTTELRANSMASGGSATGGWVDEEAVRRSVLREVLAVMLGPQAAHKVDCYQLDVQTVAAVAQQRSSNTTSTNSHTGVSAQRLAKEQADKAAAIEARARAERELVACKSMLDEERMQAKRKLDASKREAEGLVKEKRDLMARCGQQGRDARAAASALQEAQERVASLEQQVCAQQRAAAAAQRSLEQARSEHKAGMAAMEVALAAAKQEAHEVKEESKKQAERVAEEVVHQAVRALADTDAEVEELWGLLRDMQAEIEQQQQQAMHEQVAELQQAVAQLRPELGSELSELNSIVGSNVAGLEAQFRCLASECNERVSALLQLDAQISALGPEGVNKLHREVREAQLHQANAEHESRQQAIKLAGCEAHRSKLAMEKQVQATELAMLVQQQAELKRGISIADNALAKSKADVAQLTGRVTHLAQQLQHAHERADKLEAAADLAKERAAHAQQQAQEARAQQEACQQECDALREQAEQAQKQAAAGFADGVQHACTSAATQVKALRDKYFQASLIVSPPSWHQQQQQQQRHLVRSEVTKASAEQHILKESKGAVLSQGVDGRCARGASALHNNAGSGPGGSGCADGDRPSGQKKGSSSLQVSQSLAGRGNSSLQASQSLAASAAYEGAFGLKLCRLSHEGLMAALQEYNKRQGQLDIPALMQQYHNHRHSHDHPHHAFLAASNTTHAVPNSATAASTAAARAASQREQMPRGAGAECGTANNGSGAACDDANSSSMAEWGAGVCLELLWLEGCLLLALVESRQAQQQGLSLKEGGAAQTKWDEDGGKEEMEVEGEMRVVQAPAEGGAHKQGVLEGNAAKELVGQMMRAMARDRKLLQQRVHKLEAQASPHPSRTPSPHPLTFVTTPTSLPARRVLSAQPSAPLTPSSALQQLPRMHSASAATGRGSMAAAFATVAGAPVPAAVAPGRQQLLQQHQQQHQQQGALVGHAHMQVPHQSVLVAPCGGIDGGRGQAVQGPMGVRADGLNSTEPASLAPSSAPSSAPAPAPATASCHHGEAGIRGLHMDSTGPVPSLPSATPAPAPAIASPHHCASSHHGAAGIRGLHMDSTEDSSTSGPAAAWQSQADRGGNRRGEEDYDDVWGVLEALEESSLRSSRGMHGLHSVAAGGEGVMVGKRASERRGSSRGTRVMGATRGMGVAADAASVLGNGTGQALGFRARAQLSPGQAFVAQYREAGMGERGRGRRG